MQVTDIGEFALIERLRQIIAFDHPDVLVGIGDDVAVLATQGDELLLATIDCQVEKRHFLPDLITPRQLGQRALAVNLSDIAAVGGQPTFALVSLALPTSTEVEWVEELYHGLRAEADRWGVSVVGGNLTRSLAGVWIDIALLGRATRAQLILRSGAQPGDLVMVTGELGTAFVGLHLALHPDVLVDSVDRKALITHYLEPKPKLAEAAIIAQAKLATAMIDISDGLSSDLGHICEKSKVGVRVWATKLPIAPAVQRVAAIVATPPWQYALEGGDDYGLCFTAPPEAAAKLSAAITQQTDTKVTVIGEILPEVQGKRFVLPNDQEISLDSIGWQHFRKE